MAAESGVVVATSNSFTLFRETVGAAKVELEKHCH
jgi:hypothetical protein